MFSDSNGMKLEVNKESWIEVNKEVRKRVEENPKLGN